MVGDIEYEIGRDLREDTPMRALLAILFLTTGAIARDGGDWSKVDPEVRQWIQALRMPDNPGMSCCGEADAYDADFGESGPDGNYAIVTDSRGNFLPVGTRLFIPPHKVQNKQGNPSGHVIVFADTSGQVHCFIPNGAL
jgi:hypothetical protein